MFSKGWADELNRVAQLASRRQSSEARQHILARFHPVLIHELLRTDNVDRRADPDDAQGFLEADLFELERDGGALDRVATTLAHLVAEQNRRLLTDGELGLAARELRRAL